MNLSLSSFNASNPSTAGFSLSKCVYLATFSLMAATTLSVHAQSIELGNRAQQTSRAKRPTALTPIPPAPTHPAPAPSAPAKPPASATSPRAIPSPMYGVTVDDVSGLSDVVTSLSSLSKMPTTRVVFDENVAPSYYRKPVEAINKVSYVMGEILDSYYVKTLTVAGYTDRTRQYLSALGDVVDLWEVGNEINGEWLGNNADVVAKMTGAYDVVKSAGKPTALTLYYNQDCWSKPSNEMFKWSEANVPARMKQGLDYVFISYYEADCNGLKPNWQDVFQKLGAMFPNSKIGFGEVGTSSRNEKADYLTRYYTMKINTPNYVGGHFWWYFRQDMVPSTKPLLQTLNSAISAK